MRREGQVMRGKCDEVRPTFVMSPNLTEVDTVKCMPRQCLVHAVIPLKQGAADL